MSAPGPGYGRGGRGAALLKALQQPARKPGTPPATVPSAAPTGRGAKLAALLKKETTPQASPTHEPQPGTSTSHPKPGGRGALLHQALAAKSAPHSPAPKSMGRGHLLAQLTSCATSSIAASPPPTEATEPSSDGERLSKLEYMLKNIDIQKDAIVQRGTSGNRVPIAANYIPVKCRNDGVYQYAVCFNPQVDARNMRGRMLFEHDAELGGVKAFDGAILFLPILLPNKEVDFVSKRPTDGQVVTINVKLVKVLQPSKCLSLYNVIFRRMMTSLKMCQVSRNYYDPSGAIEIPHHKLQVWPGYVTAVNEYEGGLMMCIDVHHKVLRTETVLTAIWDILQKSHQNFDEVVKQLIGATVLTRYNNKTYRIDDIDFEQNPASTFHIDGGRDRPAADISYVDYFKQHYGVQIRDASQPLLIHRPKKKEMRGRRGPALEVICLVPELCYMTGLTDDMRADFRVMKDLATHTRISPMARQASIRRFCHEVNANKDARGELDKWGLELDMDTIMIEGRNVGPEKIRFGNGKSCSAGDKADWGRSIGKEPVISAVDLRNWLLVCTRRDGPIAQEFTKFMVSVGRDIGIAVSPPGMQILNDDRTESYVKAIRGSMSQHVQCVVAIFPSRRDDRYNAFKKLCCVECPVPSQAICTNTLRSQNKLRSVVIKIALQINCKMGGELWAVPIPSKTLMICGIDVYHDASHKYPSVGAFVASLNQSCTRWYSRAAHQMPGQELMDSLKLTFVAALRKYHEINHALPERIVIYRDGVGEGQLRTVADYEVKQLAECFANFGESYQPKMAVVVVCKRINTRMFAVQVQRGRLDNPPPGTIVDHTITRREWYDFFLVSQHVGQGTVSPTHYTVVYDDSEWAPDHIQKLSYKMTHLYYNWPGTVRVPAPCQYAHKLAYLIGQNIRKDPSTDLADKLYYL